MDDSIDLIEESVSVEKDDFFIEKIRQEQIKTSMQKEELAGKKEDRKLRAKWAERIYGFVSLYMLAIFFILFLCGLPLNFSLSDNVLIVLLGTTTANVIGIFMVVATYYFYRTKK